MLNAAGQQTTTATPLERPGRYVGHSINIVTNSTNANAQELGVMRLVGSAGGLRIGYGDPLTEVAFLFEKAAGAGGGTLIFTALVFLRK